MFNLTSFLPKILSFLCGWQGYLAIAVVLIGFGSFLGWKVEATIASVSISQIQHQYDDYKLAIVRRDLETSETVVLEINQKNKQIQDLTQQLFQKRTQLQEQSESLTKLLSQATTSNPLSSPVLNYLNKLRQIQRVPDHH